MVITPYRCHEEAFLSRLAHEPAMLVRVESTQGSVPREAGTWMAVFAEGLVGTIGGGHLEFEAIAQARAWLQVPGQKIEKSSVKFVDRKSVV